MMPFEIDAGVKVITFTDAYMNNWFASKKGTRVIDVLTTANTSGTITVKIIYCDS